MLKKKSKKMLKNYWLKTLKKKKLSSSKIIKYLLQIKIKLLLLILPAIIYLIKSKLNPLKYTKNLKSLSQPPIF